MMELWTYMIFIYVHNFFGCAGLDCQKKILEPAGPLFFIFGRLEKYSSCQKLS